MTTLFAVLLAVGLLVGCSGGAIDIRNAAAAPPEMLTLAEEVQPETLVYSVETELWEDTILAGDGTPLVHYAFAVPRMTVLQTDGTPITEAVGEAEEIAQGTADAFNSQFASWIDGEGLAELVTAAEEDLAWQRENGTEWYGPYELELSCCVYRAGALVSVSGTYYRFTGGNHPTTYLMSWNFDLSGGVFFTADTLAADGNLFTEGVQAVLIRQAGAVAAENAQPPEAFFWPEYETLLADWCSYTVSFDEAGMTVAFSPYELACYAAGPQVFRLSYDQLVPYLSDHGRAVLGLESS